MQHVIRIQELDQFASRKLNPSIPRRRGTAVRTGFVANSVAERPDHVQAPVGRAVVDHYHLDGPIGLIERRLDRLAYIPFRVIAGDDNRSQWRIHYRFLLFCSPTNQTAETYFPLAMEERHTLAYAFV